MNEFLTALSNLAVLLFVVSSMLAMGLSLTVSQIVAPLRNARLVVAALLCNFVLVPLLAYAITLLIPLDEPLRIGLLLLATAAGAPFLPKLAQFAHGNLAFSVGLMVLLMVVTIVYMPLVLPLLLPGVSVDPLAIAGSLVLTMLLPLGVALLVRARWPEPAHSLQPTLAQVSNLALVLLLVATVLANFQSIVGVIGTGGIVASLILIAGALLCGVLLGGPGGDTRGVVGLGTAQRNIAAGSIVATSNFADQPDVLVMLMVTATVGMLILFPVAAELGRRAQKALGGAGAVAATPAVPATPASPAVGERPA
jgi:predicted Na+-dependent transporter